MATRRLAGLGLALLGLLTLVALASRGSRPLGTGGADEHVGPEFFDYAFTSLVVVLGAGLVITLLTVRGFRGQAMPVGRRRPWWQNILALTVLVLLLALAARAHLVPHFGNPAGAGDGGAGHARQLPRDPSTRGGRDVRFKWVEVAVAGGVVLAILAGVVVARRLRRRGAAAGADPLAPVAEELSTLIDDTLDDLRSERDLRRAVIAAYARMERTLSANGLPRRRSEAPLEYLERTLGRLRASAAAVRRLTDLFEWAKFSHHDVDAAMRDEAVDALVRVRDELRAGAAVA